MPGNRTDYGTEQTDRAVKRVERRLSSVYREAQRDIDEKLKDWQERHKKRDARYRQMVAAGKMSKEDYRAWLRGQVFQEKQWQARRDEIDNILLNADRAAQNIVNDGKLGVFAANANYMGYALERDSNIDTGFVLYSEGTVARLIKDDPQILPKPAPGVQKDLAFPYYNKLMSSAITQGIVQGETISEIAGRVARTTGESSYKSAMRNARTAYTGAQNAGRIEGLHQAQRLGIKVKKKWLAILDSRTRDTHRDLDGQIQEVDDPFKSDLGDIMFPGDPTAKPALTYNCRCTLTYVYPDYPSTMPRRDAENGQIVADMTYREWEAMKQGETEPEQKLDERRIIETVEKYSADDYDKELDQLFNERDDLQDSIRRLRNDIDFADEDGISEEERNDMITELHRQEKRYDEIRETLGRDLDTKYKVESTVRTFEDVGVEYVPFQIMEKPDAESAIIETISGGDMTDGSCASLSLCYVGQKAGCDVHDFRGGMSRSVIAKDIDGILKGLADDGVNVMFGQGKTSTDAAIDGLTKMEPGKEYVMSVGAHATIVRLKPGGKILDFEYLELQSGEAVGNGWKSFGHDISTILEWRFGTTEIDDNDNVCCMADVEGLGRNPRLKKLLGFINTKESEQKKGSEGYER